MNRDLKEKISLVLEQLGVQPGDSVLVHSDMGALFQLLSFEEKKALILQGKRDQVVALFHEAIAEKVGPQGTVTALAGFTDYARFGKPFIVEESLPDLSLGSYPRFLFCLKEKYRSLNPITSMISTGSQAAYICRHDSALGYGFGSVWQKLNELSTRMLFIGVDLGFMTFVHHVEHLVGTPQIYHKIFNTPIFYQGKQVELPVTTSVRYLDYRVVYNLSRMETDLETGGLVKSSTALLAKSLRMPAVLEFLSRKLCQDPYYLLDEPPKFEPGKPPFDGIAGPEDLSLSRKVSVGDQAVAIGEVSRSFHAESPK